MLGRLRGLSDPEAKRKAIGAGFIEVFSDFAHRLEAQLDHKPRFLVQVGGGGVRRWQAQGPGGQGPGARALD